MARERKIDMVILGLLSHEDLSGYDIKKHIDGAIRFFWKGSFGSIYPALSEMEKSGLVARRSTADGGRREKILYHVTDQGTEMLTRWLNEEQAANDLKYETLLKLYFGGAEGKDAALKNIRHFEEQVKRDLAVLTVYKENLEKERKLVVSFPYVSEEHRKKIAEIKIVDTNAADIDACARMVAGTARSMGIVVTED